MATHIGKGKSTEREREERGRQKNVAAIALRQLGRSASLVRSACTPAHCDLKARAPHFILSLSPFRGLSKSEWHFFSLCRSPSRSLTQSHALFTVISARSLVSRVLSL